MKRVWSLILASSLLCFSTILQADEFSYGLGAQQIAPDTYVFMGKTEDFSRKNGGNIVNTGFIVTNDGVVVIDTGSSKRYGEQQAAAIAQVTDKPVIAVYLTHHHPDHFFGNQAYKGKAPLRALAPTIQSMQVEGGMFADNLYRMTGDWMRGSEPISADETVSAGKLAIGGHELEVIAAEGHTAGDLVLFDHTTGVLFAGDLVFNHRAPTTPHAKVAVWLETLKRLKELPFKLLVPGHGAVVKDTAAIEQTADYLAWLVATFEEAAQNGLDMTEVMQTPIPERFKNMSLVQSELRRSVAHLYPALEQQVLKDAKQ